MVGICKTHISYIRLGYKNRKKQNKVNKTSGGIAIFAKNEVANQVELYKTENDDIIWIKVKQKISEKSKYIYIGTSYVSDENKRKNISEKT